MEGAFSNGMCRCCASEGTFKDVLSKYHWMGEEEIYADMLSDCFDISLTNTTDGGLESGICEVCITQLRNAVNFKKQVLHTEMQFKKKLQEHMFKVNIVKVEVSPLDDAGNDSDNNLSDDYSGPEYDVPIKTEVEVESKPKKRGKATPASKAKKPKVEDAETSTKTENMNTRRVSDVVPDHFLRELYNEDEFSDTEEYQEVAVIEKNIDPIKSEIDAEDDFDERSPYPPPYSPLTSPRRYHQSQAEPCFSVSDCGTDGSAPPNFSGDRSRSPHRQGNVTAEPFPEQDITDGIYDEDGAEVVDDEFLVPDDHEVYARPESDVYARERSVRRRGGRRGRSGRGRPTRGRRGERWTVGKPLQFIYTTDTDVPPELANMVRDVKRRRQVKRDRIARTVREVEGENEENDRESQEDEEFQDATDGMGNPLLGEQYQRFDWFPMESFRGEEEVFQPQCTGAVCYVESAYDAFRSYWDDTILNHIVDQTNQYATRISSAGFRSDWYPTNAHEILCLFALWMMLGVIRMPTIKSCFSVDPILKTEVFRRIFSQKRYVALTRALHFVNDDPALDVFPSNSDPAANSDRSHRLRPILDYLNLKFQENYVLSKDICINESLSLWKGRLEFKQYIRSKAARFGIRSFELCESATGYLWSFLVYTGKQSSLDSLNPFVLKPTSVVLNLINPLLNKGYRLFLDNWYTSPVLARYLKINKTDCVGTLRPTRQDVPVLLTQAPLKQGQFIARHSGDVCVLTWKDQKTISMLSTCHGAHTALAHVFSKPHPQQYKPQMVLDYNKSMGGVDMKDQIMEPYLLEGKRCAKWYMKLFKRLLNCSILNARILLESSSNTIQNHLTFRLQLVDAILANHLSHCPSKRRSSTSRHIRPSHIIDHAHWPVHMEQTAHDSDRKRLNRKRCVVCLSNGRKTQKTAYMCETCKVALCAVNCFKSFHS